MAAIAATGNHLGEGNLSGGMPNRTATERKAGECVTEKPKENARAGEHTTANPLQQQEKADEEIVYRVFRDEEEDLPTIMRMVAEQLSEPYSIFTYRYFISQWPRLCRLAFCGDKCVGTIVCKQDLDRPVPRGYIGMLVVVKEFRGRGIATRLVEDAIREMAAGGCEEVALEAEVTNQGALTLYGNLGFIRSKRLHRYYLNGVDAFRLKLRLSPHVLAAAAAAAAAAVAGTVEAAATSPDGAAAAIDISQAAVAAGAKPGSASASASPSSGHGSNSSGASGEAVLEVRKDAGLSAEAMAVAGGEGGKGGGESLDMASHPHDSPSDSQMVREGGEEEGGVQMGGLYQEWLQRKALAQQQMSHGHHHHQHGGGCCGGHHHHHHQQQQQQPTPQNQQARSSKPKAGKHVGGSGPVAAGVVSKQDVGAKVAGEQTQEKEGGGVVKQSVSGGTKKDKKKGGRKK